MMKMILGKAYTEDILPRDVDTPFPYFAEPGYEPLLNKWIELKGAMGTVVICMFDGPMARDHMNIDIVEGGHPLRYAFIPLKPVIQIWIEDAMHLIDQVCVALHECHEFYKMYVEDWPYEAAHASASKVERKLRNIILEADVIIPSQQYTMKMLELELNGKDCIPYMQKVMQKTGPITKWAKEVAGTREDLADVNKKAAPREAEKSMNELIGKFRIVNLFNKAEEDDEQAVKNATKHSNKLGAGAKKRRKLRKPQNKVHAVMHEFKHRTLHSGSGEIVTKRSQAQAIAMSEAGISRKSMMEIWDRLEEKDRLAKAHGYEDYMDFLKAKGVHRDIQVHKDFTPSAPFAKKPNAKAKARQKMRKKIKFAGDVARQSRMEHSGEEVERKEEFNAKSRAEHPWILGKAFKKQRSNLYQENVKPAQSTSFEVGSVHIWKYKGRTIYVEVQNSEGFMSADGYDQGLKMIYVKSLPTKIVRDKYGSIKGIHYGWVDKEELEPYPIVTAEDRDFIAKLKEACRAQNKLENNMKDR